MAPTARKKTHKSFAAKTCVRLVPSQTQHGPMRAQREPAQTHTAHHRQRATGAPRTNKNKRSPSAPSGHEHASRVHTAHSSVHWDTSGANAWACDASRSKSVHAYPRCPSKSGHERCPEQQRIQQAPTSRPTSSLAVFSSIDSSTRVSSVSQCVSAARGRPGQCAPCGLQSLSLRFHRSWWC